MKRSIWSLVGGVILPVGYFFVLALVDGYASPSSRKALQLPIAWPRLIYFHSFPPDPNSPSFYDTFDPFLFFFLIAFNVVAYGLLVYVALVVISVLRERSSQTHY